MEENRVTTLRQLRMLAQALRATTLHCIELKGEGWSLRMTCSALPGCTAPAAPVKPPAILTSLRAPTPGQVLLRHPLLAQDFVAEGTRVKQHQLLALLKVGALYLPLRSPAAGTVMSLAIAHEEAVEFDTEILSIQEDSGARAGL